MRTPREILFEKHRAAEPELDRIRAAVVSLGSAGSARPAAGRFPLRGALLARDFFRTVWLELLWPARRAWCGFAIAWLAILIFNLADLTPASRNARPAGYNPLAAWQEQHQMLSEFFGQAESKPAPHPEANPTPQSQGRANWARG